MSKVEEIDYESLQALIARVEHAIEHELALEAEDLRLLLNAIHTLMTVQSKLEEKDVTLTKLRKLLGMVKSSEKRSSEDKATSKKNSKKKSPRKPKAKNTPAKVEHHKLEGVKKGDPCPECPKGKLSKHEPATLLRVTGNASLEAVKHIVEKLQCTLCDYVISAPIPEEVLKDGDAKQQYGYSARSVMAIHKHFSGIPYYHQGTLNDLFGWSVTASSIFDQCEYVANDSNPIFRALKHQAGNADVIYIDDTGNRILDSKPQELPKRNGSGTQLRSGIYTSGLIAITKTGKKIHLYNTNLGHAGEFLDEILRLRDSSLPPPIIMSDALSRNIPTVTANATIALCNSHGRRLFHEVEDNYPQQVKTILDLYGKIWMYNTKSTTLMHSHEERLAYHQENSLPLMAAIKIECDSYLESTSVEEHGGLGKACKYFLKHYDGLTQFCKVAGAPVDNNLMEEGLKIKIRSRKTSHFYKTQVGADVANILTSIIATAYRNDINPFYYLNSLQRNSELVKADPASWLPWTAII